MSFMIPKKPQILYSPMLASFGGGSARGFNPGGGGGGGAVVVGGTVTTYGGYSQHAFTSTSTANITFDSGGLVDILVVGAGGGGGMLGGGGGGGAVAIAQGEVAAGTYSVRVGAASATRQKGWSQSGDVASKGLSSYIDFAGSLGKVEAGGGGGGLSYADGGSDSQTTLVGNSGGFRYDQNSPGPSTFLSGNFSGGNIPTAFTVRSFYGGNSGGNGAVNCAPCNGGGGAGAGANGETNTDQGTPSGRANGGDGVQAVLDSVYFYNTSAYYWGGGGPTGPYSASVSSSPGKGGAGGSGSSISSYPGQPETTIRPSGVVWAALE